MHRLSEWAYKAPFLEEDIALSNISLDMFGRANMLLEYAANIKNDYNTYTEYKLFYKEKNIDYNHFIDWLKSNDYEIDEAGLKADWQYIQNRIIAEVANKIFNRDPFITIDERGVGELIEIATKRGRMQKKSLKLGICGEHGGDPSSVEFCEKVKLNYVSCSPYRVPIARLAAAQAYLKKKI